jgi:hypothetical protein
MSLRAEALSVAKGQRSNLGEKATQIASALMRLAMTIR